MTVEELCVMLRSSGYRMFQKAGGLLGIRGPGPLPADIMAEVRRHKEELLLLVAVSEAGATMHRHVSTKDAKGPGAAPGDTGCHAEPPHNNGNPNGDGDGFPLIPVGWPRTHWVNRLRYLADCCEPLVPDRAEWLRRWAREVEQQR